MSEADAEVDRSGREPVQPAWAREAHTAWQRLLPELRAAGWQIEVTCFNAPVQLEGAAPAGDLFYYRCRWNACELSIGGDDPVATALWRGEQTLDDRYAASFLHPDDAVRILLELHTEWLGQRDSG